MRYLTLVLLSAFMVESSGFLVNHAHNVATSIIWGWAHDRPPLIGGPSASEARLEQAATPTPLLGGVSAPRLRGTSVMQTYSLDFYRLPGGMRSATIQTLAMSVEQAVISDSIKLGRGLKGHTERG